MSRRLSSIAILLSALLLVFASTVDSVDPTDDGLLDDPFEAFDDEDDNDQFILDGLDDLEDFDFDMLENEDASAQRDNVGSNDPSSSSSSSSSSASTPQAGKLPVGGEAIGEENPLVVSEPTSYWFEAFVAVFICLFGFNFYQGRKQNDQMARRWAAYLIPLLEKQCGEVGFPDLSAATLVKEAAHIFRCYGTGRRFCKYVSLEFEMRRRQDLFWYIWEIIFPVTDRVKIEVPLVIPNQLPSSFVLALMKKRAEKAAKEASPDIETFGDVRKQDNLPSEMIAVSDSGKILMHLLNPIMREWLTKHSNVVESIVVAREDSTKMDSPMVLSCVLRAGGDELDALNADFLRVVLFPMIDLIGTMPPRPDWFKRPLEKRQKIALEEERARRLQLEEEAQKRKVERRSKEQERILSLSREEQKKLDQKDRRNVSRRQGSRMRVAGK